MARTVLVLVDDDASLLEVGSRRSARAAGQGSSTAPTVHGVRARLAGLIGRGTRSADLHHRLRRAGDDRRRRPAVVAQGAEHRIGEGGAGDAGAVRPSLRPTADRPFRCWFPPKYAQVEFPELSLSVLLAKIVLSITHGPPKSAAAKAA